MIHSAIAYLFGIHMLTPIKIAWITFTLANVSMMLWLAWRQIGSPHTFLGALYFLCSSIFVMLQGTKQWAIQAELAWTAIAACWAFSMLPRDKYGRIFVLAIGLLIGAILAMALPRPWPMYSAPMYYARLYSCVVFAAICFAIAILPWTDRYKFNWNAGIAFVWFSAVVFGSVITQWSYWEHRLAATSIWTACLVSWLCALRFSPSSQVGSRTAANAPPPRSLHGSA